MAYNNRWGAGNGNYGNQGGRQRNYNNGYQSNSRWGAGYGNAGGQARNQQVFKSSGFSVKIKEDGAVICSGWKKTRQGLVKLYARPSKGTHESKSEKSGKRWLNLFVTITNTGTAQVLKTSGMYDVAAKKLHIKEFGWIGTLNGSGHTRSGKMAYGYLGRNVRRR